MRMRITDIYDYNKLMGMIPFGAEYICDIHAGVYGYLHDVGTQITLSPMKGETPSGWDTLEEEFKEAVADVRLAWDICNNYGYH